MTKIGLLSDTHGYLDPKIFYHFSDCDEIWHAGDFGTLEVSQHLSDFKKLRGVYGNVDGQELRLLHGLENIFTIEGIKIFIIHIGGYPGHYPITLKNRLIIEKPQLFVCGHSHILKIMRDDKYEGMLAINPGAAGKHGFHKMRTLIKFTIDNEKIRDMKVIELGKRA